MYKVRLYRSSTPEPKEYDANMHEAEGNFISFYKVESGGKRSKKELVVSYNSNEVMYFKKENKEY